MKRVDIAYMAGFFDGEGCISICCSSGRWRELSLKCQVGQCNRWILELYKFRFSGSIRLQRSKNPQHHDYWMWHISSGGAAEFLKVIKPYLYLKKAEAEIGIEFQSHKRACNHLKPEERVLQEAHRILLRKAKEEIKLG